ncbi:hypothetical protein FQN51_003623 [Onygenales sp. PD_10]|nr:hypothetical protein FQN51_003623 [Onygenales sp. PD_10]
MLVSQTIRGDIQQDMPTGYGTRIGSMGEPEIKGSGSSNRKRIPVACGRCRRRKIKCSGDTGTGQCTNCRNSGTQSCQFLRVNSYMPPAKSNLSGSWPYPGAGSLGTSYGNAGGGGFEAHAGSRANAASVHSMTPSLPMYAKAQAGYENPTQFSAVSRNGYMSPCTMSYDGDSYGIPSPSYMSVGSGSYCPYPSSPRGSSQNSKISTEDLYADQDGAHHLNGSNYPSYLHQSQPQSAVSSDISPVFSIPSSSSTLSGADRTLPNPKASRSSRENGNTIPISTADTSCQLSYGTVQLLNTRSSNQPTLDGSGNPLSSMRAPSTISSESVSPTSSKPYTTSPPEMNFGYIISTSSPTTTTMTTTMPPTQFLPSEPADVGGGHGHAFQYGHTTEISSRPGRNRSLGQLSNGAAYMRPPVRSTAASSCSDVPTAYPTASLPMSKNESY